MDYKNMTENPKRNKIKYIVILTLSAIAIWLLVLLLMFVKDFLGIKKSSEIIVSIPEGAVSSAICEILENDSVIEYPFAFKLVLSAKNVVIQQGRHRLDRSMSYFQIADKLSQIPDAGYDNIFKILIPEGYELKEIADVLEKNGLIDREIFMREAEEGEFDYDFIDDIKRDKNRLEGYLFPATYEIQKGESEHKIIDKMLDAFSREIVPLYESADSEYSLDEIVTLASIIEREAANNSERPIVSSVFYNRIKKDMTLSSCATVQYILKERKKVLSISDTKIKSPYNTYREKGLPPGPIASPGAESIKAALNPADTDYLYFAARSDGSGNVFSKTDKEHLETVKKLQN